MAWKRSIRSGMQARQVELQDFLRARRARLTPVDVGLPNHGRRRTPGLRREEVALLAGVSVSWYTWLEQGRDMTLSSDALAGVSRALRLSGPEHCYLFRLAGLVADEEGAESERASGARLSALIDGWWPSPAYVTDRYWNVLAANGSARAVLGLAPGRQNLLEDIFLTTAAPTRFPQDYRGSRQQVVAQLRSQVVWHGIDERMSALMARLRGGNTDFDRLWNLHEVWEAGREADIVHTKHGVSLIFRADTLAVGPWPGPWLTVLMPVDGRTRDELSRSDHDRPMGQNHGGERNHDR
jgi:transcriptional regulator with XRE-family HTH domain